MTILFTFIIVQNFSWASLWFDPFITTKMNKLSKYNKVVCGTKLI